MPLLLGDELVARLDLKADRKGSALLVVGAYAEPGRGTGPVAEAALAELHRLRQWLGLERLSIGTRGDFVPHLIDVNRRLGHFNIRDLTAAILGIPSGQVRVVPAEIGSGFGAELAPLIEPIAALLARRPVGR